MAKYVMANRRSGKFHESEKQASRASLDSSFDTLLAPNINVIGDTRPDDIEKRRILIFEAEPAEIKAKMADLPEDVIVEPEILHFPDTSERFYASFSPFVASAIPIPTGPGATMTVTVVAGGNPLADTPATLILRGPGGQSRRSTVVTSGNGQASFTYNPLWIPTVLVVAPAHSYWSVFVRGPQDGITVEVPPLPQNGPMDWWHEALGIDVGDNRSFGGGIRVGVIDSGLGAHDFLSHVTDLGSFIDGTHDPNGGADVGSHGTHVSGIIGARPLANSYQYVGIAPEVDLFSVRVFPPGRGANQGDIADAIDFLSSDHTVDLINMSLGASEGSEILQDAIQDALERGTLCVCAAANSGGPVEYPAAFPETVAVSALGLEGWAPNGTIASARQPLEKDKFGANRMFLANFSCFGPEIDCCAPGVGIISTVPNRGGQPGFYPYGAKGGTSMASPAACGLLAVILSTTQGYSTLPRDQGRAEMARARLKASCQDLGMKAIYQGQGIPNVI